MSGQVSACYTPHNKHTPVHTSFLELILHTKLMFNNYKASKQTSKQASKQTRNYNKNKDNKNSPSQSLALMSNTYLGTDKM